MSGITGLPPPKQDMFQKVDIDENVAAKFPPGSKHISAMPHGASFWTRTARVDIELLDGTPKSYFLKVATDDLGRGMLQGEFEGITALYNVAPNAVPGPIGWGTYKSNPNTHFYLCDFIDMIEELPDVQKFCAQLAKMHKDSMSLSPNGKFGFHITTYEGTMSQDVKWCNTWEELYIRGLRTFAEQEEKVHGPSKDFEELIPPLFEKVIPRLLRPLQEGGRKLKPVLVHGDIWYGNIATNAETDEPVLFDPSVFWAHNEYDLNNFNIPRYRLGRHWMREYHKHFPVSAPEEDYEDRNLLYAIHSHFCASTLYPGNTRIRQMAIDDIRYLVNKYPQGYVGPSQIIVLSN